MDATSIKSYFKSLPADSQDVLLSELITVKANSEYNLLRCQTKYLSYALNFD